MIGCEGRICNQNSRFKGLKGSQVHYVGLILDCNDGQISGRFKVSVEYRVKLLRSKGFGLVGDLAKDRTSVVL